jgi:ferrous iron transport protein A
MSQMTAQQIPLSRLTIGQRATIVRVGGVKATRRRLLDMGLVSGETITLKAVAPLGDPIELIVKGYHLSLRKHEAHEILVEEIV